LSARDKPEPKKAEVAMTIAGRLLVVIGAVLLGVYVVARIHAAVMSRAALREFSQAEQAQQKDPPTSTAAEAPLGVKHKVDFSLWSMKRITAYEDSLSQRFARPLAVLEIPKIGVEVPVFDGTDDLTLNRGVGRIIGTARVGRGGNVGIAGHRDGFFRGLKDVLVGDRMELRMPQRTEAYQVDQIRIVSPSDVDVLKDRGVPTLTLVTCYPFYFIGNAPQRFIVRATASGEGLNGTASDSPQAAIGKIKKEEKTP
jgi:sortase A